MKTVDESAGQDLAKRFRMEFVEISSVSIKNYYLIM